MHRAIAPGIIMPSVIRSKAIAPGTLLAAWHAYKGATTYSSAVEVTWDTVVYDKDDTLGLVAAAPYVDVIVPNGATSMMFGFHGGSGGTGATFYEYSLRIDGSNTSTYGNHDGDYAQGLINGIIDVTPGEEISFFFNPNSSHSNVVLSSYGRFYA